MLLGIIDAISSGAELETMAARVAELVTAALRVDVCFVHVLDDEGRSLTLTGATPPFDAEAGQITLALGEGVSGWVAVHREPVVLIEGKDSDERYRYLPALRGEEFVSMASVPMASSHAGLAGVLNVHTRQRREFTEADVRLLTSIGSLVAGAVHQARLRRATQARRRERDEFADAVVALQEAERRRLAGEIHDGISQRVASLSFHLSAAAESLDDDPRFAAAQLAIARQLADLTIEETRAAIAGLRPPVLDDLGLAGALAGLRRRTDRVSVVTDAEDAPLPDHVSTTLFRIAQEALHNAERHGGAREIRIELTTTPDAVCLRVVDDGQGFDPSAPTGSEHFGLVSMRERAALVGGTLRVASHPGVGTTVTAIIPLPVVAR